MKNYDKTIVRGLFCNLPSILVDQLDDYCAARQITKTQLIIRLIESHLISERKRRRDLPDYRLGTKPIEPMDFFNPIESPDLSNDEDW